MPITWRSALWSEIESGLSIHSKNRGDAIVGPKAAMDGWKHMFHHPFFIASVLESIPSIKGHHLIGFGAAVVISPEFADAEIADPRPDISSRIIAGIHAGQPVLANRNQVAQANADCGVDIMVLCGSWRDEIVTPAERQVIQTIMASSFTEQHAGYRIRRILRETSCEPEREFVQRSVVFLTIAEFPDLGRVIHLMNGDSVKAVPASLGNVLFDFREPLLRLRDSDQQLLLAALTGATDQEISVRLAITMAAVKARWRSTFAQIAEAMPALVSDTGGRQGRGMQKRHRVLAYLRAHLEELRPYDWQTLKIAKALAQSTSSQG